MNRERNAALSRGGPLSEVLGGFEKSFSLDAVALDCEVGARAIL